MLDYTKPEMLELAKKFLSSLKLRNWELLRLIITPDCIWRLPGSTMISGIALGAEAVVKRATQTNCDGFSLLHILYGMNGFALSLHNQESKGGLIIDEYLTTVCTLRDNRVSGINTFLSDLEAQDRFFHF
jgi:uncharacterized protein